MLVSVAVREKCTRRGLLRHLAEIFRLPVSLGTVQNTCMRSGALLETAYGEIAASIRAAPRVYADETGWWSSGTRISLWVLCNRLVTLFAIVPRRSRKLLESFLTRGVSRVVTSDRAKVYAHFARRQLYWAHLLRNLQAIVDAAEQGAAAAQAILDNAHKVFTLWHDFKAGRICGEVLRHRTAVHVVEIRRLLETCRDGKDPKAKAFATDLLRCWPHVFRFLREEDLEPT
ncbi:MAG: transposase [Candidatus Schekmanbacteria bacterium]|nr:transposase [Candidatus Schekmanbacteria bacterium]